MPDEHCCISKNPCMRRVQTACCVRQVPPNKGALPAADVATLQRAAAAAAAHQQPPAPRPPAGAGPSPLKRRRLESQLSPLGEDEDLSRFEDDWEGLEGLKLMTYSASRLMSCPISFLRTFPGDGSDSGAPPTPLSQAGFKRLVPGKGQCLTLLSVEIVADCRCTKLTVYDLAPGPVQSPLP